VCMLADITVLLQDRFGGLAEASIGIVFVGINILVPVFLLFVFEICCLSSY